MSVLRNCFRLGCFVATLVIIVRWICTYTQDADAIQIDIKPFEFPAGQLPMVSICLLNSISESKLKEYNDTLTLSKFYQLFEEGSYHVTNDIEFDDISVNSSDIYVGEIAAFKNGSSNFRHSLPRVSASGYSGIGA